jgi:hypothetical protein
LDLDNHRAFTWMNYKVFSLGDLYRRYLRPMYDHEFRKKMTILSSRYKNCNDLSAGEGLQSGGIVLFSNTNVTAKDVIYSYVEADNDPFVFINPIDIVASISAHNPDCNISSEEIERLKDRLSALII